MNNPQIDSFAYVGALSRRVGRAWIKRAEEANAGVPIPWTPVTKPLADCRVALLSSAGIALRDDRPFNQQGERDNPWWGDGSYRIIPRGTQAADIRCYHLHINAANPQADLNCVLPLDRLDELVAAGKLGASAPSHYSTMGYVLDPTELLEESMPAIVRRMQDERVDIAVLVPV